MSRKQSSNHHGLPEAPEPQITGIFAQIVAPTPQQQSPCPVTERPWKVATGLQKVTEFDFDEVFSSASDRSLSPPPPQLSATEIEAKLKSARKEMHRAAAKFKDAEARSETPELAGGLRILVESESFLEEKIQAYTKAKEELDLKERRGIYDYTPQVRSLLLADQNMIKSFKISQEHLWSRMKKEQEKCERVRKQGAQKAIREFMAAQGRRS